MDLLEAVIKSLLNILDDKENMETAFDKENGSNKEEFYQSRRKKFINKLESSENNLNSDNSPKDENILLETNDIISF